MCASRDSYMAHLGIPFSRIEAIKFTNDFLNSSVSSDSEELCVNVY